MCFPEFHSKTLAIGDSSDQLVHTDSEICKYKYYDDPSLTIMPVDSKRCFTQQEVVLITKGVSDNKRESR